MRFTLATPQGEIVVRRATPDDAEGIYQLYRAIYHGEYTLPIVNLRAERALALADPDCYWLVNEFEGQIIGSVIFQIDRRTRNGKVSAAAVLPDYRRLDLMFHSIGAGIQKLLFDERQCDVVYATTRTRSMGPTRLLRKLKFVSLGLFPNVHRLAEYETHGLMAFFHPEAFAIRRMTPHLIPEMAGFYDIVRSGFGLEAAYVEANDGHLAMEIVRGEDVNAEFERLRDADQLLLQCFPFHTPNYMFRATTGGNIRAFLTRDGKDGHASLVGLQVDRQDMIHIAHILDVIFELGHDIGIDYLEMLIPAYEPMIQAAALQAEFLPCGYFPSFEYSEGTRLDYIVCARTTLPLNFANVQMTPRDRRFLDVYLKNTEFRNLVVKMHATGPLGLDD
ncbi:MAG: GNAT family N-acetyltransferase [Candidatus Sericytochromatia bacterium]|nr:GNAT family N-acetyltransferase [Candidatus Sericytochromatia bacterium]